MLTKRKSGMPEFDFNDHNTPLSGEEMDGLIIPTIRTRNDLNEAEALNLIEGTLWLKEKARNVDVFDDLFLCKIHKQLFGQVWEWAGTYRTTNKNIGVFWEDIPAQIRAKALDAKFWFENEVYPPEELAVRFHYELVHVHPYPNGNGRFSRIIADYIVENIFELKPLKWGNHHLIKSTDARRTYIAAIVEMDSSGNIASLLDFAMS